METLQVEKGQVQKIYTKATPQEKSLLESLFGKNVISVNIMDRVKSFEDACEIAQPSENLKVLLNYPGIDKIMNTARAGAKLMLIIEALNEGWFPDWKNLDEYKYYPWFYMDENRYSPSGFGLNGVTYYGTRSDVGSRLCFKSEELAKYAAAQFIDLYREYYTA